jgi:hypothetical protein
MDQRSWQDRWGVAELEFHHCVALVGIGFILLSPFFALVRGEAGLLAFVVGMLAFFGAAHTAPDDGDQDKG